MPIGKMMKCVQRNAVKTPRSFHLRGVLSVLARWISPQAGYQILPSIQPFANIIGDYTCQNRKHK